MDVTVVLTLPDEPDLQQSVKDQLSVGMLVDVAGVETTAKSLREGDVIEKYEASLGYVSK